MERDGREWDRIKRECQGFVSWNLKINLVIQFACPWGFQGPLTDTIILLDIFKYIPYIPYVGLVAMYI